MRTEGHTFSGLEEMRVRFVQGLAEGKIRSGDFLERERAALLMLRSPLRRNGGEIGGGIRAARSSSGGGNEGAAA